MIDPKAFSPRTKLATIVGAIRHFLAPGSTASDLSVQTDLSQSVLVTYASQTGTARELAQATGELLRQAGRRVRVVRLGDLDEALLRSHRQALFLLSTCGDGEPPGDAQQFVAEVMSSSAPKRTRFEELSFAVLALGDLHYSDFCAFGRRVDYWLRRRGARSLFPRIDVNGWETDALQRWHHSLALLTSDASLPAWPSSLDAAQSAPVPLRIAARSVLNPGSLGAPMVHVELEQANSAPLPEWEPGDLARIVVPGQYRPRDYSIASVRADGRVHLTVRRVTLQSGRPGFSSGWLADAPIGSEAQVQLIAHPSFRLEENASRPLILIASGSGIAGVRGHLRGRARRPGTRNWLLFGERQLAHDFHYREEVEAWQASGALERVDLAFSRSGEDRAYVQQRLIDAADELRAWVKSGAAIYVCGSRARMGTAVHDALFETLGAGLMQVLASEGRYRRDVY